MSALDSLDNIKHSVSKFLGPIVTLVIGVVLYLKSVSPVKVIQFDPNTNQEIVHSYTQEPYFGYAGLALVLIAIVWLLYVFNILKSIAGIAAIALTLCLGAFILYQDYLIVKKDVDLQTRYDMVYSEIKGRMLDVKKAEIEYKKEKGVYTADIDTLIDFVKNGKTISYDRAGLTPVRPLIREWANYIYGKDNRVLDNNMTDIEAKALSQWEAAPDSVKAMFEGYKRDTVYVSVLETVFNSESYKESRNKNLLYDFVPDSLKFVPFSDNLVELDTASIQNGELMLPTLLIKMPHSLDSVSQGAIKGFTHTIGDLNDNSLKDNWSY
jgi:hypothetical protein